MSLVAIISMGGEEENDSLMKLLMESRANVNEEIEIEQFEPRGNH